MDEKSPHGHSAALGIWTTLVLFSVVAASRRVAGAYTGPLPAGALVTAVLLASSASLIALWLFRQVRPRTELSLQSWLPELTAWGLPTLFSLVVAAQPTAGQLGTVMGIAGVGAVALGVAMLETFPGWPALMNTPEHRPAGVSPTPTGVEPTPTVVPSPLNSEERIPPLAIQEEEELDIDQSTTQWMSRRQDETGETVEGTVRVEFAPGQRETIAHVTFCPPLATVPEVELECVDGEDWELKPEAALPYGLRIQVRRSSMVAMEQSGLVAYLATSSRTLKAA